MSYYNYTRPKPPPDPDFYRVFAHLLNGGSLTHVRRKPDGRFTLDNDWYRPKPKPGTKR